MHSQSWQMKVKRIMRCIPNVSTTMMLILVLFMATGYTAKQTTTETTSTSESNVGVEQQQPLPATKTTTEKTTINESSTRKSDGGIFGGTFHLIGDVLAFPFRLIGNIFDAIF